MTTQNQNENASKLQEISDIECEIAAMRVEQAARQERIKALLFSEDPAQGLTHHEEIFRMQQDKLCVDTEIQFRKVALCRLKARW